ncbi:hypothetical protein HanRHA438_Chr14g0634691 [Helianthus annuus]|nr:hypothetical protein HanRHA438_Chr14g0634691 [Helianthus annuus]
MSEEDNNNLAIQLANLLKNGVQNQSQNPKPNPSDSLKINLSLNSQNYPLWARMIRVAIGGKSKALLNHLTQSPPEPMNDQWEQDDLIVFSWLIQNIEPSLASNLTEFPTAKTLWDALTVTYSSGKDKLQTFDLHVKSNEFKQNGLPLEEFWIVMQGIWGEIERRDPNPMTCSTDIITYNKLREILRWEPLPSAEAAYAAVRKETAHQNIFGNQPQGTMVGSPTGDSIGVGLATKGRRSEQKHNLSSSRVDKNHLKCEHCGMTKHTKEQCFKIVGYPDWWTDGHKKGKAAAAVGNPVTTSSGGNSELPQKTTGTHDDLEKGNQGGKCFVAAVKEEEPGSVTGHQDREDHWAWY